MEANRQHQRRAQRWGTLPTALLLCAFIAFTAGEADAQLAITEVMSQASTNSGTNLVVGKSDFWELTNFGTNTIALDGYTFSDRDPDPTVRVDDPFRNCFIAPGESIILLRTDTITNRQDFFNWWGAGNLPTNLQVRSYPKKPGFDAELDAVQLFDRNGDLVDRVDFGRALRGHTFVYDSETGEFSEFSTLGGGGAFKAVAADDVGSPGATTGPVPLSILQQPLSITDDAGADVEFSVRAAGLPRPAYQWFLNDVAIPGARTATLALTNIQPSAAANYTVRVNNGLILLSSEPATLAVNTNPSPARIIIAPSDALVFEGQTAVFIVKARGYPPPAIQWQTNGVNVAGATGSSFEIVDARLAWSGTLITVRVQNAHGATNAIVRLQVTKPPKLALTEVMASVAGGSVSGHTDWFELTNLDTNAVDLLGYRFSDRYSFEVAFQITNSLIINPGESVIFVERLTPEQFMEWWGRDRLPPDLKITTYSGLGFSSSGDVINLWNSAETDPYSPVAAGAFLESTEGVTLRFIPPDYFFVEDSVRATNGAFRAANGGDIGSPGYTTNPLPRFVSIAQGESGPVLKCRVIEGKSYELLCKPELYEADWATVGSFLADDCVLTIAPPIGYINQRFFLLKEAQ